MRNTQTDKQLAMKQCTKCKQVKELTEFNKSKHHKDGLKYQCKSCQADYAKYYIQKNKLRLNKHRVEYHKNRLQYDDLYKLRYNLRNRINSAFKRKTHYNKPKTMEALGVDWEVAKAHIERQFKKGMSWSNYGEWHIDHIIPLASANTEAELIKLCHYRNLQPLWAKENRKKHATIQKSQTYLRV